MATSTTTTKAQEDTRTITALMIVTVVFALIGHEITAVSGASAGKNLPSGKDPITTGGRILVGGSIATTLLILLSHAGEGGKDFAFALAIVTAATTTLVYGKPVWDAIANATAGAPGGASGDTRPTAPTQGTRPTSGTVPTVSALSNLA
jgi:hypothetical protein